MESAARVRLVDLRLTRIVKDPDPSAQHGIEHRLSLVLEQEPGEIEELDMYMLGYDERDSLVSEQSVYASVIRWGYANLRGDLLWGWTLAPTGEPAYYRLWIRRIPRNRDEIAQGLPVDVRVLVGPDDDIAVYATATLWTERGAGIYVASTVEIHTHDAPVEPHGLAIDGGIPAPLAHEYTVQTLWLGQGDHVLDSIVQTAPPGRPAPRVLKQEVTLNSMPPVASLRVQVFREIVGVPSDPDV